MKKFLTFIWVLFVSACSLTGEKYEEPKYSVVSKDGDIEIREYKPYIVAEVEVEGKDRDEAANKGFFILADYIFGENLPNKNIAMTAPVTQEKVGQEIAMTAPVTQEKAENGKWKIGFSMPSEYTLETLPKPKDERITIYKTVPYKTVAITFSGFWSEDNFNDHLKKLENYAINNNLKAEATPVIALYNPPFTLPWNKRNEIMFRITD